MCEAGLSVPGGGSGAPGPDGPGGSGAPGSGGPGGPRVLSYVPLVPCRWESCRCL